MLLNIASPCVAATVSIESDCKYTSGKSVITLKQELDAENSPDRGCALTGRKNIFFKPLDINEFEPRPIEGNSSIVEVSILEVRH